MNASWLEITGVALLVGAVLPARLAAQASPGPYAQIGVLHPRDGHTVEFEMGYLRHLDWHRQAKDTRAWYGWTVAFGERQRWFAYATFGRSAAELDNPVTPAEDWKDAFLNFEAHTDSWESGLYEFLPDLSGGATGVPPPTAQLELTTVVLNPGAGRAFEAALAAKRPARVPDAGVLWYRMVAGGTAPRYVRLRPRQSLSALLEDRSDQALGAGVEPLIAKLTIEILALPPT